MKEKSTHSHEFKHIVESLKSDFLVQNESSADDTAKRQALEARILAITANLEQYDDSLNEGLSHAKQPRWKQWRVAFAMPAFTVVALAAAVFMLAPSVMLPTDVSPSAGNQISFTQGDSAFVDSDLTFQELWLAEDEYLFAEEI